ncbi:MAG TPA: MEDS domain-containing protein [Candidatus Angelobacter sp.]|nr:MEDS domain-containing protein [Candidatus Angelobacter sp.]
MRPISSLVQFKRGDHICLFYRDEPSLVETLVHFLAAGRRRHERCFCVQKPHIIPLILEGLEALGMNTTLERQLGTLDIHTDDEFYYSRGSFEPQALIDALDKAIQDALTLGFTGMRIAGELSWALDGCHGNQTVLCDQIVGYERLVQRSFPGKPMIGLCQYAANLFPSDVLRRVLDAHRIAIEETMVSMNHSTLTLRAGNFLADIVTDRIRPGSAFHYVVQRRAGNDVLSWGQEPTIDAAIRTSETIMAELGSIGRYNEICPIR